MPPDGQDVPRERLTLGPELGRGGQGRVLQVDGPYSGLVYKEYIHPGAKPDALAELVSLPSAMPHSARQALLSWTCWPLARVTAQGRVSGYVMQRIPEQFTGRTASDGRQPRELQYLIYRPGPKWGEIHQPGPLERLELVRHYTGLFQLLHTHHLVVGDVSMSNLLWSAASPPGVLLIDCDGVRRLGSEPIFRQAETPDWEDPDSPPAYSAGADLASDRYKLALVVGRVLARDPAVRPGDRLDLPSELPALVLKKVHACFSAAAGTRDERPDALHWTKALDERGEIPLTRPAKRRPPNLPAAPTDARRTDRGSIPLSPPSRHRP